MLRVEARPLDEAKLKVRWTLESTVGAGQPLAVLVAYPLRSIATPFDS